MRSVVEDILRGFNLVMLVYLLVITFVYTVLMVIGWRAVNDYVRRRPLRDYQFVSRSPMTLPVSILAPAYNEAPVIAAAIRALLESQFLQFEIVVVNDGSTDETLAVLAREFDLVAVDRVPNAALETKPVRGVYVSRIEPRLVVIDKENGGKADSLNAGIRYARYPLFCAIDADTLLDPGALSRLVWEFQSYPETVAVGGIVRVLNGSTVRDGRLVDIRTPKTFVENVQVLEYLRAFLGGRIGWSRIGMLLIISGAFGLFRRDVVVAAGGYDTTTVGEDAELVVRLHRYRRERGEPCRITFFPDPICWTEAPATFRVLTRQRDRWQRGLIEMMWRHRVMFAKPRYGRLGMVAVPYYVVFEMFGPLVEALGYVAIVVSAALGLVPPVFTALILGLAVTYGLILSFGAVLMEERAYRRYPGGRDLRHLIAAAMLENFGYRQYMVIVRARAWWTFFRKQGGWGEMTRVGFATPLPTEEAPPDSAAAQTA
ncbi:MAG: glycosyltransferase [Acidimicrobiia bacterium]|jgi:cellulose synthase/poly-beta-1,6-N-acetylglucosamine synthase-like glycosyltransferase